MVVMATDMRFSLSIYHGEGENPHAHLMFSERASTTHCR